MKPDSPAAEHASHGRGASITRAASLERAPRPFQVWGFGRREALAASSAVTARRASESAPSAAAALRATPVNVAPRRPIAGINQKPATIAPAAAPDVFAA